MYVADVFGYLYRQIYYIIPFPYLSKVSHCNMPLDVFYLFIIELRCERVNFSALRELFTYSITFPR